MVATISVLTILGCHMKATPPGPTTIATSAPGMNITLVKWKEGLTVIFVNDVPGAHATKGAGSTVDPLYHQTGTGGSGAVSYQWEIDTPDGKAAACRVNGKEHNLANGALFVFKAKADGVEVHQLDRDISGIPFDADGCKEPLRKNAAVAKILGLDNAK